MDYCPQENFNNLADAISRIEQFLGLDSDTGTSTISGRVYNLENPVKIASISPTNTSIIDTVDITQINSRKWIIDYETVDGLVRTVEVLARVRPNSPDIALYNIYGVLGDNISQNTTVEISGTDMQLKITNNYSQVLDVQAYIIKLI